MSDKSAKKRILAALQASHSPLAMSDIRTALPGEGAVTERTIRRWLGEWIEQGLLERRGEKKAARYRYTGPPKHSFRFLNGLDPDLKQGLLQQLRDLWTHTSTALEGNTLTLGDTHFILTEGLTISGKPLREHQEVLGHARAIEIIYDLAGALQITKEDLFRLHLAVQTDAVSDVLKPNGAWKVEPNGTYAVSTEGKQVYIEYAAPKDVGRLMTILLTELNDWLTERFPLETAPDIYAKMHMGIAHIHPFWDGNGRIARLVANLPLLQSGLPPLVIPPDGRMDYMKSISAYQIEVGQLNAATGVWPKPGALEPFGRFCRDCYSATLGLVEQSRQVQAGREAY